MSSVFSNVFSSPPTLTLDLDEHEVEMRWGSFRTMATHVARRVLGVSLCTYFRSPASLRTATGKIYCSNTTQQEDESESKAQPVRGDPYYGISAQSFPDKCTEILLTALNKSDIEIKPDGLIYLPEIKYRRILNRAFGPGGWALMPRGDTLHFQGENDGQLITREYALFCLGRFTAQAIGEHTSYHKNNLSYGTACESAKSNALMRCCKDLGVGSELWDPQFIKEWKKEFASEVWCENVRTKEKKRLWRKKDNKEAFPYPWKELVKSV